VWLEREVMRARMSPVGGGIDWLMSIVIMIMIY